ncbi:restriction endonuclease subunit S [Variovorax paradoxus]|uniref:restriction endonuclease subunit S n=1 Tax=Variovorax paradoxus TaxID=34073 RepID=UPI003D64CCC7
MSSKTKTTAAKDEATPGLVPKLRFPEFRKAEGWKSIPLDRLAINSKQKNRDEKIDRVLTNSAEFGVVDQRDFFDKDIATQGKLDGYFIVELGSYVYNPRISSTAPVGPISKNKIGTGVMSPLYTVFKFKGGNDDFYEHFFKTTGWHAYMRQASSTGARHDRMAISGDNFMAMPLPVPSLAEQKKIAKCLTSLEELIAAQARKVDALKSHKKGLMQQLFPRRGETRPRLRFPEFQNARDWETKRIDERGEVLAGKALAVDAPGSLRPYLRTKNVLDGTIDLSDVLMMPMTDTEFSRFEILDGDVLLNEGQSLALVGRASIYRGELGQRCAMQNQLLRFRAYPSTCPEFAAQAFRQCQKDGTFASIATQTTSVAHLGSSRFSALTLAWPRLLAEQQRIAKCLTSLDTLVTNEARRLQALKTHKKGLMQQLFPSTGEVEA